MMVETQNGLLVRMSGVALPGGLHPCTYRPDKALAAFLIVAAALRPRWTQLVTRLAYAGMRCSMPHFWAYNIFPVAQNIEWLEEARGSLSP